MLVYLLGLLLFGPTPLLTYPQNTTKVSFYETGEVTAFGEAFNPEDFTAASPTLPHNSLVLLHHQNQWVAVRINDRGPFATDSLGHAIWPLQPHPTRGFDLSRAAFAELANLDCGVIPVQVMLVLAHGHD